MNRGVNIERNRRRQSDFLRGQLDDQVKKLQKENLALNKQLQAVRKCASCTCRGDRCKQTATFGELLHKGMHATLMASTSTLPPVDPEQPQPEMTYRELETLRIANDSLQNCVDNLQQLLKEKALEAARMEQQHLEDLRERDRQIDSLHEQEVRNDFRTTAFLKEREQLIRKMQQLEEQLQKCQFSKSATTTTVQLSAESVGKDEPNIPLIDVFSSELQKAYDKIKTLERKLASQQQNNAADDVSTRSHLSTLRNHLEQLEQYKTNCERQLAEQEGTLHQLETDIAILMEERADFKRRCAQLERLSDEAIAENAKHLKTVHELRSQLMRSQEKQNENARTHIAEIEAYQTLLKQKEAERALFIEQLCADDRAINIDDSTPIIRQEVSLERQRLLEVKEQLEKSTFENEKLTIEMARLKSELTSMANQLCDKEQVLQQEISTNNILNQKLAETSKMISEMEIQLMDANNQIKHFEVILIKMETDLANANHSLEVEQKSNTALKSAVDEIEELLRVKTTELIALSANAQMANSDAQRHKETVFDLETKLALQGRELKDTRTKLLELKAKIKQLKKEAINISPRNAPSTTHTASSSLTKSPSASSFL